MAIGVIFGILFAAFAVGAMILAGVMFRRGNKTSGIVGIVFSVLMIIGFILVPFSIQTVDTGEVAVVKHLGKAARVRHAGTHFDLWITEDYQRYDAKVQNIDIETTAYSSDAQTMEIKMTLQYQIMGDKVMEIASQYGSLEVLQSRIESIAVEKTKAILSSHKAMNIIADRASMSPAAEAAIRDAIGEEYFANVTAFVLTNIDFSDAFELAVEEKMIAEQEQLKSEYENQTKVAQAEASARAAVVAAEAEAKATVVAAEAEARANELLENSLTDKILREMYINKWDGALPQVVAGENGASIMIPVEPSQPDLNP